MSESIKPLFTWRSAVASERGPDDSTVRFVLLTLSLHMNEKGESCFPSLSQLAEETNLARATVSRKLKRARELGWIDRKTFTRNGQHRREYRPQVPRGVLIEDQRGVDRGSTPGLIEDQHSSTSVSTSSSTSDAFLRCKNETAGGGFDAGGAWRHRAMKHFRERLEDEGAPFAAPFIGRLVMKKEIPLEQTRFLYENLGDLLERIENRGITAENFETFGGTLEGRLGDIWRRFWESRAFEENNETRSGGGEAENDDREPAGRDRTAEEKNRQLSALDDWVNT